MLPSKFDASIQPEKFDRSLTKVDQAAQRAQWKSSMTKFTRLLWSVAPRAGTH